MEPILHRSRSISDVSSFSTTLFKSCYPIRVRALCVEDILAPVVAYALPWLREIAFLFLDGVAKQPDNVMGTSVVIVMQTRGSKNIF